MKHRMSLLSRTIGMALGLIFAAGYASADNASQSQSGPTTEITIYKVKDPKTFVGVHDFVINGLSRAPGFVDGRAIVSETDPSVFGTIITWKSVQAAQAVAEHQAKNPNAKVFFDSVEEITLFDNFATRIAVDGPQPRLTAN